MPTTVRPGDEFVYSLSFENRGTRPAPADYTTFVHLEEANAPSCVRIFVQQDRTPEPPTSTWSAGRRVEIGPRTIQVPRDLPEGDYRVHVGLYDPHVAGALLAEAGVGTLRVERTAPPSDEWQPPPLSAEECELRRSRLAGRLGTPITLEGDGWSFALDPASGAWMIVDHRTDALWTSNPALPRFGVARVVRPDGTGVDLDVGRFDRVERIDGALVCAWSPPPASGVDGIDVRLTFDVAPGREALRMRAESSSNSTWRLASLAVLDRALTTTGAQRGYGVLPRDNGYLLPVTRGLPQERRYDTYDDTSMAMFGATQGNSAILVAWEDVSTVLRTHLEAVDVATVPGGRSLSFSLELAAGVGAVELQPLGKGGYVEIAQAYRRIAARRGLLDTLAAKRARSPGLARLSGAALFRTTALMRSQPGGVRGLGDAEVVGVQNRFEDIANAAEHWRRDLDLDRALVIVRGWNRRGYDNGLPDVLPANEECGGDRELAACAERVRRQGFLFGLHDNSQDMYEDAPSWDECVLELDRDGAPRSAGLWEGGRAYRICSARQALFAEPNWFEMATRYGLDHLFADTILSVKLGGCSSPQHPVDRTDDVEAKRALCELAHQRFASVGGEGGKEWGVPLLDVFEGLLSHKLSERTPQTVIPLFELVYGDCVHLQSMQEHCIDACDARRVLDHALYAEAPEFWVDDRDYFSGARGEELAVLPEVAACDTAPSGRPSLKWRFRVGADVASNHEFFAHFRALDAPRNGLIEFQEGFRPAVATARWRRGDVFETPARELDVGALHDGTWEVLVGFTLDGARRSVLGLPSQRGRHRIGVLRREDGRWNFELSPWSQASAAFARGADGWGRELCRADRSIKNVYELLSPLARLTEDMPMTDHRFLNESLAAERTRFGDATIVANYAEEPLAVGDALLPQYGVLIESPTFVAFHALRWGGIDYPNGALFTLTSLDGLPLDRSRRVRVYHGFGDARVRCGGRTVDVEREAIFER
ncbi:MAG: hypothetical protein K8S98_09180 [Planctomycetes bacterium]|nr:hypothetical protein [Planctomycetota bacterium]